MEIWYTTKWSQLRSLIANITSRAIDEIWDDIQSNSTEWPVALSDIIQQYLSYRLDELKHSDSDQKIAAIEKYGHALTLFANPQPLIELLSKEQAINKSEDAGFVKSVIISLVKKYLEDSRRSLYHHGDPQKKRNIENWEKIDRLSKQVLEKKGTQLQQTNRCCSQHFVEVAKAAKAASHNGVQNMEKIAELFWNFCPDCLSLVPDYESVYVESSHTPHMAVSVTPSELMVLQGLLPDENLGDECLDLLEEHEPQIFEAISVKWKLGSNVTYLTEQAYYQSQGLSYRAYTKTLESGMELLTDCITDHANSRLQEARENTV